MSTTTQLQDSTNEYVIHHLNCGTTNPFPARLVTGEGGYFEHGHQVCHCLLIEAGGKLILVDTGFGTKDVQDPKKQLGSFFNSFAKRAYSLEECASEQVKQLGFSPKDVTDIIVTHLDVDHAGGLADFPHANVHVLAAELEAVISPRAFKERWGYRQTQLGHDVKWAPHTLTDKTWFGFKSLQPIEDVPGILMIDLPGHSRGHAGVAVATSTS